MYKLTHQAILDYYDYVRSVLRVAVNNKYAPRGAYVAVARACTANLNRALHEAVFGDSTVLVDNGSVVHDSVLFVDDNDSYKIGATYSSVGNPYDPKRHTIYVVEAGKQELITRIQGRKPFNTGAHRFHSFTGSDQTIVILAGIRENATVVTFGVCAPYGAPIRYMCNLEALCIVDTDYNRIPAKLITEAQLIRALHQELDDETGLLEIYSAAIYNVECNTEIAAVELYKGTPIPTPD
jgi:hypothetical protein